MENLALISANPVLGLGYSPNSTPLSSNQCSGLPIRLRKSSIRPSSTRPTSKIIFQIGLCSSNSSGFVKNVRKGSVRSGFFASASLKSDSSQETTSVGVNPEVYVPPPSSQFGSRLLWIGVGVGLAALFSWVARRLKEYAMNQAFKTMMNQMGTQNNQFGNAGFPPGMPFPFPPPPTPGPASSPAPSTTSTPSTSPSPVASQASVTVDVSASKVEAAESMDAKDVTDSQTEPKKYAFVDVSPEETMQKSPFGDFTEPSVMSPNAEAVQNGAAGATFEDFKSSQEPGSLLTVEALEKMMEDPAMQKMIYPYLPQEMRDPATFKWMLQNPQYRQQLQDMLNKMGNVNEWDERMLENLKKFDLNSPEVKQQFDQIGMTPEEVISKIMANPDVAMAFQNPRVQQAIMDCSQNPMNIAKYQNDKEVMDVFNKISELFPGVTGSP